MTSAPQSATTPDEKRAIPPPGFFICSSCGCLVCWDYNLQHNHVVHGGEQPDCSFVLDLGPDYEPLVCTEKDAHPGDHRLVGKWTRRRT